MFVDVDPSIMYYCTITTITPLSHEKKSINLKSMRYKGVYTSRGRRKNLRADVQVYPPDHLYFLDITDSPKNLH